MSSCVRVFFPLWWRLHAEHIAGTLDECVLEASAVARKGQSCTARELDALSIPSNSYKDCQGGPQTVARFENFRCVRSSSEGVGSHTDSSSMPSSWPKCWSASLVA